MIAIIAGVELIIQGMITFLVILELKKKKTFTKKNFILNYLTYLYISHMVLIIVIAILIPIIMS
jgi:hypothetical protein